MMMAQLQQDRDKLNLAPKKFVMWLFVVASFLLFAAFTSAFIVYSNGTNHPLKMKLPSIFIVSTSAIVLSSITMILASRAAKQLQIAKQRMFLWFTLALGIVFCVVQVIAWSELIKMGVYFINPNATQSFVYVFTFVHLIHILAGLGFVISGLVTTYQNKPQAINLFRMEMSSIFWHFVDIMWIYLYVFLLLNQN